MEIKGHLSVAESFSLVGKRQAEETGDQYAPLDRVDAREKVEGEAAEAVRAQEGHEESEADENHDVDILPQPVEACHLLSSLRLVHHRRGIAVVVVVREDEIEHDDDRLSTSKELCESRGNIRYDRERFVVLLDRLRDLGHLAYDQNQLVMRIR